ncbi:MAG: PEP-CTERM sorting domain-containing protein [Verrucomicrobiota bacterium]|nr:PEP-CTERM sorting domain-containing protein [Verrucomicrobiota bacterium]
MHKKTTKPLHTRVDSTLLLAAAALGAAALPAGTTEAALVTSGPVNLVIPNTADGLYINFVTGVSNGTASLVPGYDFDPYSGLSNLLFYWGGTAALNSGLAGSTTGPYLVLQPGAIIGAGNTYAQAANGASNETAAWLVGVNGYLGVQFRNESTGIQNFGYVHLLTTGAAGFPATILDYGYENTGASVTIPSAIPEPTTVALLGTFALGAVGVRAWKRRQA